MAATEGALQFANPMIAAYLFKDWGWGRWRGVLNLQVVLLFCACVWDLAGYRL